MTALSPETLLKAYAYGVFPMGEDRDDPSVYWVDPEFRGILPLDKFHVPKRLARTVRSDKFRTTIDADFRGTIEACAEIKSGRLSTWINDDIIANYTALHDMGHAHSVETWRDGKIVGGLYGVSLGAAFFGESMFSRETDASKVALCRLVAQLIVGGYKLLDTQFITDHLTQFGAIEISRDTYQAILQNAVVQPAEFSSLPSGCSGSIIMQSINQIS